MLKFSYRNLVDKNRCVIPPKDFFPFVIENIVTINKKMREIVRLAERVAKTEAPVLITGPSGVGKELLAEFIHNNSKRCFGPFIKLNCAAIPENLIESEFFGYEPGAFTGASRSGKKGVVELAEEGTLFLDEIGEMALNLQAKLLRVLQDKKFLKVGGQKELQADVRIIAASNKDLERMIAKGTFREDLYYRLNVIPILIPPLKERKEDIPVLALYFILYFNRQYNTDKILSVEVMEEFMSYSWPGNIRELKNTIERLVLISTDNIITQKDLVYSNFAVKKYQEVNTYNACSDFDSFPRRSLKSLVAEFEKTIILQAVKKYGSIRKAADALDVNPSTLSRKISSYNRDM